MSVGLAYSNVSLLDSKFVTKDQMQDDIQEIVTRYKRLEKICKANRWKSAINRRRH